MIRFVKDPMADFERDLAGDLVHGNHRPMPRCSARAVLRHMRRINRRQAERERILLGYLETGGEA